MRQARSRCHACMMVATLTAAATTGACTAKHVACCNWTATGAWATTGAGRRSVRADIASSISRVSWPHAAQLSVSAWPWRHCDCGSHASQIDQVMMQVRSEEHTSELQSQSNLVCRLLLEKKKKKK